MNQVQLAHNLKVINGNNHRFNSSVYALKIERNKKKNSFITSSQRGGVLLMLDSILLSKLKISHYPFFSNFHDDEWWIAQCIFILIWCGEFCIIGHHTILSTKENRGKKINKTQKNSHTCTHARTRTHAHTHVHIHWKGHSCE